MNSNTAINNKRNRIADDEEEKEIMTPISEMLQRVGSLQGQAIKAPARSAERQRALEELAVELLNPFLINKLAEAPKHLSEVFDLLLIVTPRPRLWKKKKGADDNDNEVLYFGNSGRKLLASFLTSLSSVIVRMKDFELAHRHAIWVLSTLLHLLHMEDERGQTLSLDSDEETAMAAIEIVNRCLGFRGDESVDELLGSFGPIFFRRFWGNIAAVIADGRTALEKYSNEAYGLVLDVTVEMADLFGVDPLLKMIDDGFGGQDEARLRDATEELVMELIASVEAEY